MYRAYQPSDIPAPPQRAPPLPPPRDQEMFYTVPNVTGAGSRRVDSNMAESMAPLSIGGLETARPRQALQDADSSNSDDMSLVSSSSRNTRNLDVVQAKKDVYDAFYDGVVNKMISEEEAHLMIKKLEKESDKGFRRTYVRGRPAKRLIEGAPVLKVGLTYLPGADKPAVNRLEQTNMMSKGLPDQKDATWRVDTAASLLREFRVTRDLSVEFIDQTEEIAQNALVRSRNRRSMYIPQSPSQSIVMHDRVQDAVTIDSDHVKIVNNLAAHKGEFDLECTLIEVDAPSIMDLIVRYRHLIRRGGPVNDFEETKSILETMIEDVRRLCHRSPILFRMSTRMKIISSTNTRYGFDQGRMFQTLTTSRGIQELISFSASYYNSLDPDRGDLETSAQKYIRPRFLQMIVVLLSLLNDADLTEIRSFIESTYKFKADRKNLELLIFKVIPLMSINSKVFLGSMVPAFEGWSPREPEEEEYGHYWDTFLKQILPLGYILPGTISTLGRDPLSWVYKWPDKGIKSSTIFANLQYSGPTLQAFNDIPPIEELSPDDDSTELTVIMTNDNKYTIRPSDYEAIVCLAPGTYSIQEALTGGRHYDIHIREDHLNRATKEALRIINAIIGQINYQLTAPRRSGSVRRLISKRKSDDLSRLRDCKISGRLTKHVATLNGYTLAVAYKLEGRKIEQRDVVGVMAQDNREIMEVVRYYRAAMSDQLSNLMSPEQHRMLDQELNSVQNLIQEAEDVRHSIEEDPVSLSEPIVMVIQPPGVDVFGKRVWYPYRAWSTSVHGASLVIEAKRSTTTNVVWLSDGIVEVSLAGSEAKYFLNPLNPVDEARQQDEVQVGDIAVLAGGYVIIAVPNEDEMSTPLILTNFLRISSVEEPVESMRGRNRAGGRGANRMGNRDGPVQVMFA